MILNSLADIKAQLGITTSADDTLLTQLIDTAEDYIQEHCSRSFSGGSFTEDFDGSLRMLLLRNYPLSGVTSVKVDSTRTFGSETILESESYLIHSARGMIESLNGSFLAGSSRAPGTVRVVYTTASDAVPEAVKRASTELVGQWYRQVKTFADTSQLNISVKADGTTYPWGQATGFRIPPGIRQLLEPYRVPGV